MAVLGLRFCARAFSSCGKLGPLFIAAPPDAEHRLQTHWLSNCGSRAQFLHGMWDPPKPGLEPVSPALAGRFSTTAPPGKPSSYIFNLRLCIMLANVHEENSATHKYLVAKGEIILIAFSDHFYQYILF